MGPLLPGTDYHIGLLIAASVPCTLASAVLWTRRAGGSEATALLVIFITNATGWLFTTGWLALTTRTTVAFAFAEMMWDLLITLVLPVTLGQLARAVPFLALLADRRKVVLGVVSQLLVICILFKAAGAVGERLRRNSVDLAPLFFVAALCLGLHTFGLLLGLWTSRWWGFDRPRQLAVGFAGSQKTLPVALLLFEQYYQGTYPLAVVPLTFYHLGQLLVDTFVADVSARPRTHSSGAAQAGTD
jgi:sodium/bile acid cotransporter 7